MQKFKQSYEQFFGKWEDVNNGVNEENNEDGGDV
jgi:hypothetical protein